MWPFGKHVSLIDPELPLILLFKYKKEVNKFAENKNIDYKNDGQTKSVENSLINLSDLGTIYLENNEDAPSDQRDKVVPTLPSHSCRAQYIPSSQPLQNIAYLDWYSW